MSYSCFRVRYKSGKFDSGESPYKVKTGIPFKVFVRSSDFSFDPFFSKKAAKVKMLDRVCLKSAPDSDPRFHIISDPLTERYLKDEEMALVSIIDSAGERLIFMSGERTIALPDGWELSLMREKGKFRLTVGKEEKLI
ncbi:MAG: hypothetical protein WC926_04610 [Candidatus Paceibacterota bacterium]|jgi:hypothetical protein|nr:hypothetical protein [Candidatus Omnitrophota bacterium]